MCGLCGVLRLDGLPAGATHIARMGATMVHRGPDSDGTWTDGPVGFAHRRLAIIDLTTAGHQPMMNEDGDVVIVYNGELYNYRQLRGELEKKDHRFSSETDTEVIIHAYEEWGSACLDRFNGHFAFAIWDGSNKELFLARDRFGVKPLYYFCDGGKFLFSSEIKGILAYPGVPRGICYPALNEYFTFQNIFTDLTLFEGIRLLPAGCFIKLDLDTGAPPVQKRYWDFTIPENPLEISRDEAAEEVFRLFEQAVERQLMSDVPLGCYLSGGMDSGSITAVARQRLGRLSTFTCGFDLSSASGLELGFDERANAEKMANLFKTEHYESVLHAGDMEHVMPELIWHLEDPRVGQCYPNYYVARLASKFVKVVLSGAGGDELFGGYPWRYYRALNSNGSKDYFRSYYDFWQRLVPDEEKESLFNSGVFKHLQDSSTFEVFRGVFGQEQENPETNEDFFNASLYFELKTFLHGLLLVEDKVSMAHNLETRTPFLDNDLVDFAMQLPMEFKIRNLGREESVVDEDDVNKRKRYEFQTGDGKVVLREAMERLVPAEVTKRVKQGFSAPDASWFRGESIDYINKLLRNPKARINEFLNPEYVVKKLDEHTSGKVNRRLLIWSMLSFEWWLKTFH